MKTVGIIVISRMGIINDVIYRKISKNNKKKYVIYHGSRRRLLKFNSKERKIIGASYYIKN